MSDDCTLTNKALHIGDDAEAWIQELIISMGLTEEEQALMRNPTSLYTNTSPKCSICGSAVILQNIEEETQFIIERAEECNDCWQKLGRVNLLDQTLGQIRDELKAEGD